MSELSSVVFLWVALYLRVFWVALKTLLSPTRWRIEPVSPIKPTFIRGCHNLRPEHRHNVVTIGSFDGVHLGHQAILKQVCDQAKRLNVASLAMIFEPQPHEYFAGEKAPARLMRLGEKAQALFAAGIDRVFCLPFNRKLSELSAQAFIDEILVERLGVKHLVVGDDFRFGAGRTGDYALLTDNGKRQSFTVVDTHTYLAGDERVSSTRIRQLLEQSEFAEAKRLLGKPYTINGRVVKGKQLGRTLGAPTANVHLHRYRSPLSGVFAVVVSINGHTHKGVANVGVRPTVGGDTKPILEVHLFDFANDIYGEQISVECVYKLRDEQKFDGIEALTEQIHRDMQYAKDYFQKHPIE